MTTIADVIVPETFTPYFVQQTEVKDRLVRSGAVVRDNELDAKLAGGGLIFSVPSMQDLADDEENVSSDQGADATPGSFATSLEKQVRLSRNRPWKETDLAAALAGVRPVAAAGALVGGYWSRRRQAALVATLQGVFADNAQAPDAGDTHTQDDMTIDISGAGYSAGVTDFSAEATVDTLATMGDSEDQIGIALMHSLTYARARKNNLIDFIPDSEGQVMIPTYLGKTVIVDDGMPNPAGAGAAQTGAGIFHTWFLGAGAIRMGFNTPANATAIQRNELANNGGGETVLMTRTETILHPVGYAYIGNSPGGGSTSRSAASSTASSDPWAGVLSEGVRLHLPPTLLPRDHHELPSPTRCSQRCPSQL